MNWKKPAGIWQWLLLFTPAVAAMLAFWLATTFFPVSPFEHEGRQLPNVGAAIGQALDVTFGTIVVASLGLAFVFAAGQTVLKRALSFLGVCLWLVVVNAFVAFGGCTAVGCVGSVVNLPR